MILECISCDEVTDCELVGDFDLALCPTCKKLWKQNIIIEMRENE